MKKANISKILRAMHEKKCTATRVYGAVGSEDSGIEDRFITELAPLGVDTQHKLLDTIRTVLRGEQGTTMTEVTMKEDGPEFEQMRSLRDKDWDDGVLDNFYEQISSCIDIKGRYVILMVSNIATLGRPSKKDTEEVDPEVFRHFLCAICPLRDANKGGSIGYTKKANALELLESNEQVGKPVLGFCYPCLDGDGAAIQKAMLYSKKMDADNKAFISTLFGKQEQLSRTRQKEVFAETIAESLGEEYSYQVAAKIESNLSSLIEATYENPENDEPSTLAKEHIPLILKGCDLEREVVEGFREKMEEMLDKAPEINPVSLVNRKQDDIIETPNVRIKVKSAHRDLISTKKINGKKYVLISAEEGVTLNGVELKIND